MINTDTARERVIIADEARKALSGWFNALQDRNAFFAGTAVNGRAWRAELRRAPAPYGVMMCEGYHALLRQLQSVMSVQSCDRLALAIFSAVVAHAHNNNPRRSFAAQLGEQLEGRVCLSALRFDRLQQTTDPGEFCQQLRRAVQLRGDAGVNIVSLADGIFLWMREWQQREEHQPENPDPFSRLRIRWASEYLSAGK